MTDFVAWLESRRKFAKLMMELAIVNKDKKDESYYLGRMHEAKLIKHHLTKKKTRRKNQKEIELLAKNEAADTGTGARSPKEEHPPYPAGHTK